MKQLKQQHHCFNWVGGNIRRKPSFSPPKTMGVLYRSALRHIPALFLKLFDISIVAYIGGGFMGI